ncbi:MAG: hypothetical protein WCW40_03485 [Bacteroidota bacterium]
MASYLQMGHDSENLIGEQDLDAFIGVILSPVNSLPTKMHSSIQAIKKGNSDLDIILDPQLYVPKSQNKKLIKHPYFQKNIVSEDTQSTKWWLATAKKLSKYSMQLGVNSVASPVIVPKIWNEDYYTTCLNTANDLREVTNNDIKVLSTVLVNINEISDETQRMKIASILSDTSANGFYIVLYGDTDPRREFSEESLLFGMMSLIKEFTFSGKQILVSNTSSDMILYKVAGATNCASGKFFNLRRFTKSRYEEPSNGGGGQLPYWFEHSLVSFLREADLLKLQAEGLNNLVGNLRSKNYWSDEILQNLNSLHKATKEPWLKYSWRQYLSWFSHTENDIDQSREKYSLVLSWLKSAESNWLQIEDNDIYFDEQRNNGSWVRPWLQALVKFKKSNQ